MSGSGDSPPASAVVCLVDSSSTVLEQWPILLKDYLSQLLNRIAVGHGMHASVLRMGWITYGPEDSRPTPLLAKRFFGPASEMAAELGLRQPSRLSLGRTKGSVPQGMAVLEAVVAAIEMFDLFLPPDHLERGESSSTPRTACQIIHVAAWDVDDATAPSYNSMSELDDLSWSNIPDALHKRGINWNLICLQNTPRLSEIHSGAVTGKSVAPWFPIKPHHTVSLVGLPPAADKVKRSLDAAIAVPPDAKRPRTGTAPTPSSPAAPTSLPPAASASVLKVPTPPFTATSPSAANVTTNSSPLQPPSVNKPPASATAPPPQVAPTLPNAVAAPPAAAAAAAAATARPPLTPQRFDAYREQVKLGFEKLLVLQSQGRQQEAQMLHKQLTAATAQLRNMMDANNARQGLALQQEPTKPAGDTGGGAPPASGSAPPSINAPGTLQDKLMSEQMRKMVEQQQAAQRQTQVPQIMGVALPPQPGHLPQQATSQQDWVGEMYFTGSNANTHQPREIRLEVRAQPSNPRHGHYRPDLWPKSLQLTPSREHAHQVGFKAWVTKFQPAVTIIKPEAREIDAATNSQKFGALKDLLEKGNCYALAGWPNASGVKQNTVLIASLGLQQAMLVACFLPTGIEEMPGRPEPDGAPQMIQHPSRPGQAPHAPKSQEGSPMALPFGAHGVQPPQAMLNAQPGLNVGAMNQMQGLMGGMPANMGNLSMEMLQSFAMRNANGGNSG